MGVLTELYDDSPRVRFLEALLELAPIDFTASQAAKQVGDNRASFYRIVESIEADGLIIRVSDNPVKYRVNENDPRFQIMAAGEAALRIIDASRPDPPPDSLLTQHRRSLVRVTSQSFRAALTTPPGNDTDMAPSDSFSLVTP